MFTSDGLLLAGESATPRKIVVVRGTCLASDKGSDYLDKDLKPCSPSQDISYFTGLFLRN